MITIPGMIDIGSEISDGQWTGALETACRNGFTGLLAAPRADTWFSAPEEAAESLSEAAAAPRVDYGQFAALSYQNVRDLENWYNEAPAAYIELKEPTKDDVFRYMNVQTRAFSRWPKEKPIVVRAAGNLLGTPLFMAQVNKKHLHVCEVTTRTEIELIREAKEQGTSVSCSIHPLALMMTNASGNCPLRRCGTGDDRRALLENLPLIDCFSSAGLIAPPGHPFAGMEMMPALLVSMLEKGLMTQEEIAARFCTNPRNIFGLYPQSETAVEIDEETRRVVSVKLRGEEIFPNAGECSGIRLKGYRA